MRILMGALALIFMLSQGAASYGPIGHRIVASLAYQHLSPEAKAAVLEILGDELMEEASTWPDEMRSSPDPYFGRTAAPFHYVNMPDGVTYNESEKNPVGDAVTALAAFSETLKDTNKSKEERALALRYIIHIIGDLHQPLHAGRAEDRGGNRIDVDWFEERTNLHVVWDERLIQHKQLSYSEWVTFLSPKIKPEHVTEWQNSTPVDWVDELVSYRGDIYNYPAQILEWDYVYKFTPLLKSQLSKGGVRLAGYLNQLFAK